MLQSNSVSTNMSPIRITIEVVAFLAFGGWFDRLTINGSTSFDSAQDKSLTIKRTVNGCNGLKGFMLNGFTVKGANGLGGYAGRKF